MTSLSTVARQAIVHNDTYQKSEHELQYAEYYNKKDLNVFHAGII